MFSVSPSSSGRSPRSRACSSRAWPRCSSLAPCGRWGACGARIAAPTAGVGDGDRNDGVPDLRSVDPAWPRRGEGGSVARRSSARRRLDQRGDSATVRTRILPRVWAQHARGARRREARTRRSRRGRDGPVGRGARMGSCWRLLSLHVAKGRRWRQCSTTSHAVRDAYVLATLPRAARSRHPAPERRLLSASAVHTTEGT